MVTDTLNQAGILIERPTQAVCFKLQQLGSRQTDQNLSKSCVSSDESSSVWDYGGNCKKLVHNG